MDVNCPNCGAQEFQEISYRYTWQPVTLDVTDDGVDTVDYGSFDYGDDVMVVGVGCYGCDEVWRSYEDLAKALRGQKHTKGEFEPIFHD
jgi:hypothetical protein